MRWLDVKDAFAVDGFVPETVRVDPASLVCAGWLAVPAGRRRVALVARRDGGDAPVRTDRLSLSFHVIGPIRGDLPPDERGRVADVLRHAARDEDHLLAAMEAAPGAGPSRSWTLDESDGDRRIPDDLVQAAAAGPLRRLSIRVRLRANCLQACRFCPRTVPVYGPDDWASDLALFERLATSVFRPASARGVAVDVDFSADDLASHGRLRPIFELVSRECACPVRLVLPGVQLADARRARELASLPGVEAVVVTLMGDRPEVHDDLVGRAGAFRESLLAVRNLLATGWVQVALNFVPTASNLDNLNGVLAIAAALDVPLAVPFLVSDCGAHRSLLAPLFPRLDLVRAALAAAGPRIASPAVTLVDFPVCAVPPGLRASATRRHPPESLVDYPEIGACTGCRHRPACIRVPAAYLDAFGEDGLLREDP